jgi:uncharacterized protein YjbI with pentapeptide repeats
MSDDSHAVGSSSGQLAPVVNLRFRLDEDRATVNKFLVQAAEAAFAKLDHAPGGSLRELMEAAGVEEMRGVDLAGVDLRGQDLSGIDFEGADLREADLRKCNLVGARFQNALLEGAKRDGAIGGEFDDGPPLVVRPTIY